MKLPSSASLKPAASTSLRKNASSIRCRVPDSEMPVPGRPEVVGDHVHSSGFERGKHRFVHLRAIHAQEAKVVIVEHQGNKVELAGSSFGGMGDSKGCTTAMMLPAAGFLDRSASLSGEVRGPAGLGTATTAGV